MKKFVWAMLILPCVLLAQNKTASVDSLLVVLSKSKTDTPKVGTLNKLSVAYVRTDSTKGLNYATQALELAQKLQWEEGIARSYFYLATQYLVHFHYKKALLYFDKSLKIAKDKRLQSKIHAGMGSCYMYESDYSKALASYHRGLKIDESLGDKKGIGKMAMNIGSVYYSIKDYPKSIAFFNKSLDQKNDDPYFNAMLLRNIGAVYNSMDQLEKALVYFDRSLLLCEKMNNKAFEASLLSDIALVYYDLEDYAKAIRYSKSAMQINTGVEDKVNIAFSFGIIGDSYTEKAKQEGNKRILLDSAVFYLHKSIALHGELNSIRGLYDDYTSLTTAQKLQGDFKTAIQSYETSIVYKDSIFNSDNRETIRNLEDKRAIEIRDKELKINNLELEANQRQKWLLSLGIVFLGVIGGLLYYQSASRKETNRNLHSMNADLDRANNIKTRLLSILNHDLRSPVNSFIHYIQFRKESPELLDEAAKTRIEDATLHSARNLLNSMEDMLLWTKDQMKNFGPQPEKFHISTLFDAIEKHFSVVKNTSIAFEFNDFEIYGDENYLKTIVRNLTANAINATHDRAEPKIIWRAWHKAGQYFISISDNGPGVAADQLDVLYDDREVGSVKSGLGLHLVRDLVNAIGWKIAVDSDATGTTFTLSNI
jgi:signal transduction histidine kinase/Tfp pilus assembly protein PilF